MCLGIYFVDLLTLLGDVLGDVLSFSPTTIRSPKCWLITFTFIFVCKHMTIIIVEFSSLATGCLLADINVLFLELPSQQNMIVMPGHILAQCFAMSYHTPLLTMHIGQGTGSNLEY